MPKGKKLNSKAILGKADEILDKCTPISQAQPIECEIKCLENEHEFKWSENRRRYHMSSLAKERTIKYFRKKLGQEENEVFAAIFLDSELRALVFVPLSVGTTNTTLLHQRLIVQRALYYNADAVILAHNHPVGGVKPSLADRYVTRQLKHVLHLIDVQVLDHIIVSKTAFFSMADHGMI